MGVGGLIIIIHGELLETEPLPKSSPTLRSFDRTFVLGPGIGVGGIRVASDVLMLRAYGGCQAWKKEDFDPTRSMPHILIASAEPRLPLPDGFGVPAPGKEVEQVRKEGLALELSKMTRLNLEYSGMCLEQSGWTLDAAMITFERAKVASDFQADPDKFANNYIGRHTGRGFSGRLGERDMMQDILLH